MSSIKKETFTAYSWRAERYNSTLHALLTARQKLLFAAEIKASESVCVFLAGKCNCEGIMADKLTVDARQKLAGIQLNSVGLSELIENIVRDHLYIALADIILMHHIRKTVCIDSNGKARIVDACYPCVVHSYILHFRKHWSHRINGSPVFYSACASFNIRIDLRFQKLKPFILPLIARIRLMNIEMLQIMFNFTKNFRYILWLQGILHF